MNGFKKEKSWIYRLRIPFDTVYTSVFLIRSAFGNLLVDCASSGEDVERYILPSLEKKGAFSLGDQCSHTNTQTQRSRLGRKEVEHCICECKKYVKEA